MIPLLLSEQARVDAAFAIAKRLPYDEEVLAHWAKYLCVLVSGLIESGVRHILAEYARRHSSTEAASFTISRLDGNTNLKAQKIRELLGAFSQDWGSDFEKEISDEQRAAIDSIVANRNNIAHGRHIGMSLVQMQDYYDSARDVLRWMHKRVLGTV